MRKIAKYAVSAAGALMMTSGAMAADLPVMVAAPPPVVTAPAFNWAGAYVGAFGGWSIGIFDAGVQAGYNMVSGGFVGGIEARVGAGFAGGAFAFGTLSARAGFLAGPNVLLYGAAGIGIASIGAVTFYTVGGGVEFAVGSNMSLFVEGRALGLFGGGCCGASIQAGLNWHL